MDWIQIITIILPIVTAIVGWLVGRRKQKNDFLKELQSSINLLAAENARLLSENLEFRKEIIELKVKVHELETKIKQS
jgi:lipopolysaccharide biosynthesis regulator YciM